MNDKLVLAVQMSRHCYERVARDDATAYDRDWRSINIYERFKNAVTIIAAAVS